MDLIGVAKMLIATLLRDGIFKYISFILICGIGFIKIK